MTAFFKLTIPKPCHNNWEEMLPNEKGRYCLDCSKTVIDFTNFTDEAIKEYFTINQQSTCGRFYKKQLDRITIRIPGYVLQKKLPRWKQFLLLLLICFGSMVLPVEVNAFNINNTFTETTVKKDTVKKKKKHRKRKQKYINLKAYPYIFEDVEMGLFLPAPIPPIIIIDTPIDKNPIQIINDAEAKFSIAYEGISKKNKPSQKKPYQPVEAALPVLASARIFGKKKKK